MMAFTKGWVQSISKTINENGCWISDYCVDRDGYARVGLAAKTYKLARVVMSIYHNIDYFKFEVQTLHGTGCDKACFNPEHIRPGSQSENMKQVVSDGGHFHSKKTSCPKCGGPYTLRKFRQPSKITGQTYHRYCKSCRNTARRKIKT